MSPTKQLILMEHVRQFHFGSFRYRPCYGSERSQMQNREDTDLMEATANPASGSGQGTFCRIFSKKSFKSNIWAMES